MAGASKYPYGENAKKYLDLAYYLKDYKLHIWDYSHASWIAMDKALQTRSQKKMVNKSALMTSKKYGGLDPYEIQMYQAVESICDKTYKLQIPHDVLMIVLIYSQGFKFETDDVVITFPTGIFGESHHCVILDTIEDANHDQMYLMSRVQRYSGSELRKYGGNCRIPLHRVFANKLVIIDAEQFNALYGQQTGGPPMKYGDVLDVRQLQVVKEAVYSKKKKRNITKMSVQMGCVKLQNTAVREWPREPKRSWNSYGGMDTSGTIVVKYDSSIFVQAKWKKVVD